MKLHHDGAVLMCSHKGNPSHKEEQILILGNNCLEEPKLSPYNLFRDCSSRIFDFWFRNLVVFS